MTDNDQKEYRLVQLLNERGMTIATCESCTGGLVSQRITNVPGSSNVFGYGVCTYANEAKQKLLGVHAETLQTCGAVSKETALQMASGMLALSGADMAVSTTGIAGPGGGTPAKPVGLVYTAIVCRDGFQQCKKLMLGEEKNACRDSIRHAASSEALQLAIDYLEQKHE